MSLNLNHCNKKDCPCIPDNVFKNKESRYQHIIDSHIPPINTIANLFYVPSMSSVLPSNKKYKIEITFNVIPEIKNKLFSFDGKEWVTAPEGAIATSPAEVVAAYREKRSVRDLDKCSCDPDLKIKSKYERYYHIIDHHTPPRNTMAILHYTPDDLSLQPTARAHKITKLFTKRYGQPPQLIKKMFSFNGDNWVDPVESAKATPIDEVIAAHLGKREVNPTFSQGSASMQKSRVKKQKVKHESENAMLMPSGTIAPMLLFGSMPSAFPNPISAPIPFQGASEEGVDRMCELDQFKMHIPENDDPNATFIPKKEWSGQEQGALELACQEDALLSDVE